MIHNRFAAVSATLILLCSVQYQAFGHSTKSAQPEQHETAEEAPAKATKPLFETCGINLHPQGLSAQITDCRNKNPDTNILADKAGAWNMVYFGRGGEMFWFNPESKDFKKLSVLEQPQMRLLSIPKAIGLWWETDPSDQAERNTLKSVLKMKDCKLFKGCPRPLK